MEIFTAQIENYYFCRSVVCLCKLTDLEKKPCVDAFLSVNLMKMHRTALSFQTHF